jgi:hypothetical protein
VIRNRQSRNGLSPKPDGASRIKAQPERENKLTEELARQIMGWEVAPDRFLMGSRRWIPRWRFKPAERLEDAFRLLEEAAPRQYTMGRVEKGAFWVSVQIGAGTGEARDESKPRAITYAVARAIGMQVNE